jgi:succinate-acetate transporter protein
MSSNLGNPAPLGLLAFGMTTAMLMFVDAGWAESDFAYVVAMYAVVYGGLGQVLVAIFELMKGSSFSFAVFFSYGAFWLGWAFLFIERKKDYSTYSEAEYRTGMALFFSLWGVLSTCFWIVTLRKNVCLIVVFALLCITFFLLAAAEATSNLATKRAAGYVGFLTAAGALYTGVAELINEEWGRHVLPGLRPLLTPERLRITKESIMKRTSYDKKTNSLFLQFNGLQVYRAEDITAIRAAVKESIMDYTSDQKDHKVHVIVDYRDVTIAKELEEKYWAMTRYLERGYYLSVRRFYVSSFGTKSQPQILRDAAISTEFQFNDSDGEDNANVESTLKTDTERDSK